MTLRELLKQNELRVVEVAAGADGLARTISGAVMFDNPEMVNWMRAGEIMLTTGYFLLDDGIFMRYRPLCCSWPMSCTSR